MYTRCLEPLLANCRACCLQALKEYGIKVTTIYPPATSTNMTWDRPDLDADYGMEVQVCSSCCVIPSCNGGKLLLLKPAVAALLILHLGVDQHC